MLAGCLLCAHACPWPCVALLVALSVRMLALGRVKQAQAVAVGRLRGFRKSMSYIPSAQASERQRKTESERQRARAGGRARERASLRASCGRISRRDIFAGVGEWEACDESGHDSATVVREAATVIRESGHDA